jgi:hypothetical protein
MAWDGQIADDEGLMDKNMSGKSPDDDEPGWHV